jgi:uncharacterized OB-fold protein
VAELDTQLLTEDAWIGRLPSRSPETEPFWEACNRGEFLVQRCADCGKVQYHYRKICAFCWSDAVEDVVSVGEGTVWTYTVVHKNRSPAVEGKVPYVVVLIELDEGVRVFGNLVECDPEDVEIGTPVKLAFSPAADGQMIPVFRLRG